MFAKGVKVGSKQWKAEQVECRSIGCQMKECWHIQSQRMPSQIEAVNVGSEHCHGAFNIGSVFSQEWWNSGTINSYVGISMVEHRNQNTSMRWIWMSWMRHWEYCCSNAPASGCHEGSLINGGYRTEWPTHLRQRTEHVGLLLEFLTLSRHNNHDAFFYSHKTGHYCTKFLKQELKVKKLQYKIIYL